MAFISIDMAKILYNVQWYTALALRNDVDLVLVGKVVRSNPSLIIPLIKMGIKSLADSNMDNFVALAQQNICLHTSLIKTRLSDIRSLPLLPPAARLNRVYLSDTSMLEEIRKLDAQFHPEIVLIVEVGDLKEGLYPDEVLSIARQYQDLPIIGVSSNFACMSGKMPDIRTMMELRKLSDKISDGFVSIGGTVVTNLLQTGQLRGLVSEIRIGEGIFFGLDSSSDCCLAGLQNNAFTLYGEIVEVKEKLVQMPADAGLTSLGADCPKRKMGRRRCAVLDFGVLVARAETLFLMDSGLEIVGQTFDFTVVDVTDSDCEYQTGGFIAFTVHYAGAATSFMNDYVVKKLA